MMDKAECTGADYVKCGFQEFTDDGKIVGIKTFLEDHIEENNIAHDKLLPLYFENVLYKIACAGLYKRELALKVKFPEGLINEDNYSAGMYLFYAEKICTMTNAFYFYRNNHDGLSKKGRYKRPLDIVLVTAKLHEELSEKNLNNKYFLLRLRKKLAREFFHCVRLSGSHAFKLLKIDKSFYFFVLTNLDLRRKLQMIYYRWKYKIELK